MRPRQFDDTQEDIPIVRFSRTNPPASVEEALSTMDEVELDITQIETKLEYTYSESFENDRAYRIWRHRAIGALGYSRHELKFLRQWIQNQPKPARPAHVDVKGGTKNIEQARLLGRELADGIRPKYATLYTADSLPQDLSAAEARRALLVAIKQEIIAGFDRITETCTSCQLPQNVIRDAIRAAKIPLKEILLQVESELGVLKGYQRRHVIGAKSEE